MTNSIFDDVILLWTYKHLNFMMLTLRQGFGLNTNLLETNVLNLAVVVGITVTVVGDALSSLLHLRREKILSELSEADEKAKKARQQLADAQDRVESARSQAQAIRIQAIQAADRESLMIQEQLRADLQSLKERRRQAIQMERQRALRSIARKVADSALRDAENLLLTKLAPQGQTLSKQKELNQVHVRDSLRKIKS